MKFQPGTKVRYRDYREPDTAPMTHIGTVRMHGNKWITLTDEKTGKEAWSKLDGAEALPSLTAEQEKEFLEKYNFAERVKKVMERDPTISREEAEDTIRRSIILNQLPNEGSQSLETAETAEKLQQEGNQDPLGHYETGMLLYYWEDEKKESGGKHVGRYRGHIGTSVMVETIPAYKSPAMRITVPFRRIELIYTIDELKEEVEAGNAQCTHETGVNQYGQCNSCHVEIQPQEVTNGEGLQNNQ